MSKLLLPYSEAVTKGGSGGGSRLAYLEGTCTSQPDMAAYASSTAAGLVDLSIGAREGGVCNADEAAATLSELLLAAAHACEGLSGRTLRKLPFLAHAGSPQLLQAIPCPARQFLRALMEAVEREQSDRSQLLSG